MSNETKQLTIRIPVDLFERLKERAEEEKRSINSCVACLIEKVLKKDSEKAKTEKDVLVESWLLVENRWLKERFIDYYGLRDACDEALVRYPYGDEEVVRDFFAKLDEKEQKSWLDLAKKLDSTVFEDLTLQDVIYAWNTSSTIKEFASRLQVPYATAYFKLQFLLAKLTQFEKDVVKLREHMSRRRGEKR